MFKYFIGVPYLMTAVLLALNLFGVTVLSWWVVFLPSIIVTIMMFGTACMFIGGILFILAVLKVIQDKQQQSTEEFLNTLREQINSAENVTVH